MNRSRRRSRLSTIDDRIAVLEELVEQGETSVIGSAKRKNISDRATTLKQGRVLCSHS
jgi:hypothetical protein